MSAGDILVLTSRGVLGLLFLTSSLGKLRDVRGFAAGLRAYRILPASIVPVVALLLPLLELGLALALLLGLALPFAGLLSAGLLLVFSAAVVVNLRRGRPIACTCHGLAGSQHISWGLVARNCLLLAPCSVLVWLGTAASWSLSSPLALFGVALLVGSWFVLASLVHQVIDTTLAVHRAVGQR